MTEPIDNEDFENKKKAAELDKLNKEIKKIEAETKEIISRKRSAWAPMIGSLIIGAATLGITYGTGFFDGKLALVEAETLVIQVRKDSLSRTIDSLKSNYRRDSINSLSRINSQNKQLDSLEQKFIQDKLKFDKERVKYGYVISQKEREIGGLRNENNKIDECIIKAEKFLKYCIRYDEPDPSLNNSEFLIGGYKPPYKTRFSLSLEEIANLNILSLTYDQFLKDFAGYKVVGKPGMGYNDYINSSDGNMRVIVSPSLYGNFKATTRNNIKEIYFQFECYKSLSNTQKLKLLKQMIVRPY
jgi:hypothetical protein